MPNGPTEPPGSQRYEHLTISEREAAATYEGLVLLQAFLGKAGPEGRARRPYSERDAINVMDRIVARFPRLKTTYRPERRGRLGGIFG